MSAHESNEPLLVSIEMGYGHMRAAHALGQAMRLPVLLVDQPPQARPSEQQTWARLRRIYEAISRLSQLSRLGAPLRFFMESLTDIPNLHPVRDHGSGGA